MRESLLVELEQLFLALSDKTRLRLLALMADGEVPVGFLADKLGESQPKVSRHLAYLRASGLVSTRREGKWIYYGIETGLRVEVGAVLDAALRSILGHGVDDSVRRPITRDGDAYRPYDSELDISADTYMDDWRPAELEIHLL